MCINSLNFPSTVELFYEEFMHKICYGIKFKMNLFLFLKMLASKYCANYFSTFHFSLKMFLE